MGAVLGLEVDLGVPVGVEEDDGVGGGEVDAEAAGAGRKEEDELRGIRRVVAVDHVLIKNMSKNVKTSRRGRT